ncbi:MAG TPA: hypothetical protein ENH35_02980 [Candidatus Moranbacteria bacterium]|nr:hypothetical protein [Candidatus Pacearchaeota archaeon]HDZ85482.1 hypothetical protein [Candidatus Moranbacteria bacterium]
MANDIDCTEKESKLNTLEIKKDRLSGKTEKECLKKAVDYKTFNKISKKQFIWLAEKGYLGEQIQQYARDLFWNGVWNKWDNPTKNKRKVAN